MVEVFNEMTHLGMATRQTPGHMTARLTVAMKVV